MKDLATLIGNYRKNVGLMPDYVWFREGEDSAQVDGGYLGDIRQSTYCTEIQNIEEESADSEKEDYGNFVQSAYYTGILIFAPNLKIMHEMALKEKLMETMPKSL